MIWYRRTNAALPLPMTSIACLMIVFGGAEVATGFSHNFFGIRLAEGASSGHASAIVGALYAAAGLLVLTGKRLGALLAVVLLAMVIAGRIAMVWTGLYPIDSRRQAAAIVLGTAIAAGFALYIGLSRSLFR